ncbi:DUF6414 family protein [Halolamina sp. C58]|uniref:DUF6414 family protein n=1 Tax=Halolamina sp. C58 TaxID=3421640 RepID=UPI003EBE95CD
MPRLREFVYIDNSSLNSNLSSLGRGVPSEIIHSSEDQTEKGGSAGGRIAGIGADGQYADLDSEQIETTLNITAPFRFQDLLDEVEKHEIEVKENPDPRGVSRGDLVKITGDVLPMSLLKFEMAIDAFRRLSDEDLNQALKVLGEGTMVSETQRKKFDAFSTVIEGFSGEYPIRLKTGDYTYCTELERKNMRQSVFDVFGRTEEYQLFGRVKRHIPVSQSWEPINVLDILERYNLEEGTSEGFIEDMRQGAEDLGITIHDEDIRVKGHTAEIEPIAMYW